ncbi:uncharacterized protein LOC135937611 [Cloeon dipterum]|uniref:uncharacterized protein LOC135937611 n=1 Tax=Cloeon dipterum TaxID=197152 RepID=UPI0032203B99
MEAALMEGDEEAVLQLHPGVGDLPQEPDRQPSIAELTHQLKDADEARNRLKAQLERRARVAQSAAKAAEPQKIRLREGEQRQTAMAAKRDRVTESTQRERDPAIKRSRTMPTKPGMQRPPPTVTVTPVDRQGQKPKEAASSSKPPVPPLPDLRSVLSRPPQPLPETRPCLQPSSPADPRHPITPLPPPAALPRQAPMAALFDLVPSRSSSDSSLGRDELEGVIRQIVTGLRQMPTAEDVRALTGEVARLRNCLETNRGAQRISLTEAVLCIGDRMARRTRDEPRESALPTEKNVNQKVPIGCPRSVTRLPPVGTQMGTHWLYRMSNPSGTREWSCPEFGHQMGTH